LQIKLNCQARTGRVKERNMELKEVQEFLKTNADKPEVKDYVKGFITPDGVAGFIDTDEGKKVIQPKLDGHFTKSLETWKTNNLQKMIDEEVGKEVSKRYPAETPEQKRLKQLETDLEREKTSRVKSELKMTAITEATQKGLPVELVDYFVGQDIDSTKINLSLLEKTIKDAQKKWTDEIFKKYGRKPEGPEPGSEGLYTKEEVSKMTQAEVIKNIDKIRKSQAIW
jgi:hypothetical protein